MQFAPLKPTEPLSGCSDCSAVHIFSTLNHDGRHSPAGLGAWGTTHPNLCDPSTPWAQGSAAATLESAGSQYLGTQRSAGRPGMDNVTAGFSSVAHVPFTAADATPDLERFRCCTSLYTMEDHQAGVRCRQSACQTGFGHFGPANVVHVGGPGVLDLSAGGIQDLPVARKPFAFAAPALRGGGGPYLAGAPALAYMLARRGETPASTISYVESAPLMGPTPDDLLLMQPFSLPLHPGRNLNASRLHLPSATRDAVGIPTSLTQGSWAGLPTGQPGCAPAISPTAITPPAVPGATPVTAGNHVAVGSGGVAAEAATGAAVHVGGAQPPTTSTLEPSNSTSRAVTTPGVQQLQLARPASSSPAARNTVVKCEGPHTMCALPHARNPSPPRPCTSLGGAAALVPDLLAELPPDLAPVVLAKVSTRGRGGRQPAANPLAVDPHMDPRKARRILANRQSAARSKMKQRVLLETLRINKELQSRESGCAHEEVTSLRTQLVQLKAANARLEELNHSLAGQVEELTQRLQEAGSSAVVCSGTSNMIADTQLGGGEGEEDAAMPRVASATELAQPDLTAMWWDAQPLEWRGAQSLGGFSDVLGSAPVGPC